jgi:ABC-type Na+ efflux pump permease subunit
MSRIGTILSKDFAGLSKEKTYVSILVLQIILFSTARSFTAGVILISDPDQAAGIFDLGKLVTFGMLYNNTLSQDLVSKGADVLFFTETNDGIQALRNERIDMFVATPDNLGAVINSNEEIIVDVYFSEKDSKKDLALLLLKSALDDFKREVRRIRSPEENVFLSIMSAELPENIRELEMLYTFTLPLLLLFSVIISGSLVIDLITEEIERNTLQKLMQTPTSMREILFSKSVLPALLTIILAFFWISIFALQGIIIQNMLPLIAFLFFMSLIYCSIGLLVSCSFKKNKNSQTFYTVVIILSLFVITSTSTEFLPAFVVADLAMDTSFNIAPLLFWMMSSIVFYIFSILISPKLVGELA